MNLNITKTGIFNGQIIEPFLTLADGSKWILLLYHYIDQGNNMFSSSNATYCNDFGLFSRLKYIDNFTYDNKYEFYVIQDDIEFRWSQTNAPFTTTSVTGYTNIGSNSPGGGLCKCNGNTVLAASNTTGNWWRACGCWTVYTNAGVTGLPGFGTTSPQRMAQYYLALYARVDNFNAFAENKIINGNQIYEY